MAERAAPCNRRSWLSALGLAGFGLGGLGSVADPVRAQVTEIDASTTIDSPGTYRVTADIETEGDGLIIEEGATGARIDGDGHRLMGDGTGAGIRIHSSDIVLRNVDISGFETAVTDGADPGTLGEQITLENLDISDTARGVHASQVFLSSDAAPEDGWTIRDCTFENLPEIAVSLHQMSGAIIEDSVIRNCETALWQDEAWEIHIRDSLVEASGIVQLSTGSVSESIIREGAGLEINPTPIDPTDNTEVSIVDNELRNNDVGIRVAALHAAIRDNTITDNDIGIQLISDGADYASASIQHNRIHNKNRTVLEGTEGEIDATCNWWGHPTGPRHEDNPVADPKGERLEGEVTFLPWLVLDEGESVDAATCDGGWTYESAADGVYTDLASELVFVLSESGTTVEYAVTIDGEVEAGELGSMPSIEHSTVSGRLGPERGITNLYFDGEIEAIDLQDTERVRLYLADAQNREKVREVDPTAYPTTPSDPNDQEGDDDEDTTADSTHNDEATDIADEDDSPPGGDDVVPGFGVLGGLAAISGLGYLLKRKRGENDS